MYRETTIEWMKLRITSMIWNIGSKRKKKPTNQNKKKKELKEMRIV